MIRGGAVLTGRLGMSPLIATVLLMAFAVALGGMIMNLSIDISTNSECKDLQEHISVSNFCHRDKDILLNLQSTAEGPALQEVKLVISTGDIETELNVKNAQLEPNRRLELSIPYQITAEASVDLIGVVGPRGEPYTCYENPIERVDPIQPC